MSMKVTILGSSSATPAKGRGLTSHLLNHDQRFFLIDCGEGTQMQLRKFKFRMVKINHIFISHLHGDHYYGLIGLISSFSLIGRNTDLHIYGPALLRDIIDIQLKASNTELCYALHFHPIDALEKRVIYEDKKLTVETIPLLHSIPTCGFLFKEKQKERKLIKEKIQKEDLPIEAMKALKRGEDYTHVDGTVLFNKSITIDPPKPLSYAFCSDTGFDESIVPQIKNVDTLYHEATFANDNTNEAEGRYHSTAQQAATIAKQAGAKNLIIGHFSARYEDLNLLLNEAREVFDSTILAEDGLSVDVEFNI